jgi:hypothetical protein
MSYSARTFTDVNLPRGRYLAWLALNGEPSDVVLAMVANFSAWGSYCRTVARALRTNYGFDDAGCAFFDFFAAPPPGGDEPALAVVQASLDAGRASPARARRTSRSASALPADVGSIPRGPPQPSP